MRPCRLIAVIFLAALGVCPSAKAGDSSPAGITFFRADVTVREDSTLDVREEITVNDAAAYYKRGFRRDLPISRRMIGGIRATWDPIKKNDDIRVNILEVKQDGRPVNYTQGSGYGSIRRS